MRGANSKSEKEMLEIRHTIIEMKNTLDSKLNVAEERINQLKGEEMETSQTDTQKRKNK